MNAAMQAHTTVTEFARELHSIGITAVNIPHLAIIVDSLTRNPTITEQIKQVAKKTVRDADYIPFIEYLEKKLKKTSPSRTTPFIQQIVEQVRNIFATNFLSEGEVKSMLTFIFQGNEEQLGKKAKKYPRLALTDLRSRVQSIISLASVTTAQQLIDQVVKKHPSEIKKAFNNFLIKPTRPVQVIEIDDDEGENIVSQNIQEPPASIPPKEDRWEKDYDFFSYEPQQSIEKQVLLIIISDQKVKSIRLIKHQFPIKVEITAKYKNNIIVKVPLNFSLPGIDLSQCSIHVEFSSSFFSLSNQVMVLPLSKEIRWYKSKGIVVLNNLQSKQRMMQQKLSLILSSKQLYMSGQDWKYLSKWWYALKRAYQTIRNDSPEPAEEDLKEIMKTLAPLITPSAAYNKYLVWLLWSIFSKQLWSAIRECTNLFKNRLTADKYVLPPLDPDGNQEQFLELIYLRTLFYSGSEQSYKQKILSLNLQNQSESAQKEMVLEASDKEFEKFLPLFIDTIMNNKSISIPNFINKYLPWLEKKMNEEYTIRNRQSLTDKKAFYSAKIIEVVKQIRQKCQKMYKNYHHSQSELRNVKTTVYNLLFQLNPTSSTSELTLAEMSLRDYIKISKDIFQFQEDISRELINALMLNQFTIKEKLAMKFQPYFILFLLEPTVPQHNTYIKQFILSNPRHLFKFLSEGSDHATILDCLGKIDVCLQLSEEGKAQILRLIGPGSAYAQLAHLPSYQRVKEQLTGIAPDQNRHQASTQLKDNQENGRIEVVKQQNERSLMKKASKIKEFSLKSTKLQVLIIVSSKTTYKSIRDQRKGETFRLVDQTDEGEMRLHHIILEMAEANDLHNSPLKLVAQNREKILDTKQMRLENSIGIIWEDEYSLSNKEYAFAVVSSIFFLSQDDKKDKLSHKKLRLWATLLANQVKNKLTLSQFKIQLAKQLSKIKVTYKLLISAIIVCDTSFADKLQSFVEDDSLWKGPFLLKPQYQYVPQDLEQQSKILKYLVLRLLMSFLRSNRSITISSVTKMMEANLCFQDDKTIKQIVLWILRSEFLGKKEVKNILTDINQVLTEKLISSRTISNQQFLRIKLFYILDLIEKKRNYRNLEAVDTLLNQLQKKCSGINHAEEKIGLNISHQTLHQLFFIPLENNQGGFFLNKQKFICQSSKDYLRIYQKIKSIPDESIRKIFQDFLKETNAVQLKQYLRTSFKDTLEGLSRNALSQDEKSIITQFIKSERMEIGHVFAIFEIICDSETKESDQIQQLMLTINLKDMCLYKDKFMRKLEDLYTKIETSQKAKLIRLFTKLLSTLFINDKEFISYFHSTSTLTVEELKHEYVYKICHQFNLLNGQSQKQEELLFDSLMKAFQTQHESSTEIKSYIINIYFSAFSKKKPSSKEMCDELWKALLIASNHLQLLRLKYNQRYDEVMEQTMNKLKEGRYLRNEIDNLYSNGDYIKRILHNIRLQELIKGEYIKTRKIIEKIQNLESIFSSIDLLSAEGEKVKTIRKDNDQQLRTLNQITQDYSSIAEISKEIKILKCLPCWNSENIKDYRDLRNQTDKCKKIINEKANSTATMTFKEFNEYFLPLQYDDLQLIFAKQKCEYLNRLVTIVSTNNLNVIYATITSVIFIRKSFHKAETNIVQEGIAQTMEDLCSAIEKGDITINQIQSAVEETVAYLNSEFKNWRSSFIFTILRTTSKCKELFTMIDAVKPDEQSLKKLRQFTNEIQNCLIKNETVREFEGVIEYWKVVRSCQHFPDLIKKLDNFAKKGSISNFQLFDRNIENIFNFRIVLFQKLQEANNRTSSFINEIEAILTQSILRIVVNAQDVDVEVEKNGPIIEVVSFKKLNDYKEKSLLQVHSQNDSEQTEKKIEMLKEYCSLFNQIESIRIIIKQLVSYGYNPNAIACQIDIHHQDFRLVSRKKVEMQTLKQQWVDEIKKIYSNSFLLTHFTGSKLVQFVDSILSRVYYPSLSNILSISQQKYEAMLNSDHIFDILSQAQRAGPIETIRIIANIFASDPVMQEEDWIINQILLVTSNPSFFNCHILKENNNQLPLPTQIMYCHEKTVPQELQFFLYRAMIDYRHKYFIVGAHLLSENVKNSFCLILNELKRLRTKDFERSSLVFIDNEELNVVYSYLCKPKKFNILKKLNYEATSREESEKISKTLANKINEAYLITSTKAGLGKTHYVERVARQHLKVHHFPICGNINLKKLGRRLKGINFEGSQILLLKIGYVINKNLLNIFLQQLVLFKCFYAEQYIYLHQDTVIYVELENIFVFGSQPDAYIEEEYDILSLLKQNKREIRLTRFDPKEICFEEAPLKHLYVYYYLELLQTKRILQTNAKFPDFERNMAPSDSRKIQLLQKYYLNRIQRAGSTTFLLYTNLMKMLFLLFETFSNMSILNPQIIRLQPRYRHFSIQNYRAEFLLICIENALNLLQQVFTENMIEERVRDQNQRNFGQMTKDISLLIMPDCFREAFKFVSFRSDRIPTQLKVFNTIQDPRANKQLGGEPTIEQVEAIYRLYSLETLTSQHLQKEMLQILYAVSQDERARFEGTNEMLQNYVLTKDNFFKMCLLIQRERCGIPCIIQGESGVGKTALITFLSQNIFKNSKIIKNIHAGIHEEDLIKFVEQIKIKAQQVQNKSYSNQYFEKRQQKLWVFFDEFNTSDELSYIKQMVIEHRFMGQPLPQNIQFFAACNPYRLLKPGPKVEVGLKKRSSNASQLAFRVHSPPLSMIQLMWDYQQLTKIENQSYISNMLKEINCTQKHVLIQAMVQLHEFVKKAIEISAVSLRDVERVKQLYAWFELYFLNLSTLKKKAFKLNEGAQKRVIALTLIFCYCLRFSQDENRGQMMQIIEQRMKWKQGECQRILQEQQYRFIQNIENLPSDIAINQALKQNIFTTFVCLMNKIPILIIGNPGSSKSLSVNILASNLTGKGSQSEICKHYPEINMIYFQGSESSTSAGVEEVFKKAESLVSEKYEYLNCIYFDEIGLAQNSVHNPLKVLHSKLQIHGKRMFSFIGVSNYELDAAKMSRFLVLNRSSPSERDLRETAKSIFEKLSNYRKTRNSKLILEEISDLGTYYYNFIKLWNAHQSHNSGFFGLRDFYNYVKYVSKRVQQSGSIQNIRDYVFEAIQINFDGQKRSIDLFLNALPTEKFQFRFSNLNPIQMINENLNDPYSRCLLEIVQGDTLIPYVQRKLSDRKCVIHYGSAFQQDEKSEEYNYEITNKVMCHMSKGQIIIFKDPNGSIQSSLYDLFNKAYTRNQGKKYCRIAVGANSNYQCLVHEDFNAIIFVEESKVRKLDLPFLNRFEKHYLNLSNLLTNKNYHIKQIIMEWLRTVLKTQNDILTQENYILNSSEPSIITLLLKYEQLHESEQIIQIKKALLKNRTTDFQILYKNTDQSSHITEQLADIVSQIPQIHQVQSDMIIYTYDQYIHLEQSNAEIIKSSYRLRIAELESQKQLKAEIKKGLSNDQYQKLIIILKYSRDYKFIQQILYLAKQIKNEQKSDRQIIIIIQLHRFSFIASDKKELKNINISYLHDYEQYFYEDFESSIAHIVHKQRTTYFDIFQSVTSQEPDYLNTLYNEALSMIKLRFEDKSANNGALYFEELSRLNSNGSYWKSLYDFVREILENESEPVNYQLLQSNRQEVSICSNIFEAAKRCISAISKKIIVLYLRLLLQKKYILQFSSQLRKLYLDNNEETYNLLNFYRVQMKQQLKYIKKDVFAGGIKYLNAVSEENESNQILIKESRSYFELFQTLREIQTNYKSFKQFNRTQKDQSIHNWIAFQCAYQKALERSETARNIFEDSELRRFLLSDIIVHISTTTLTPKQLHFISSYFSTKLICSQQLTVYLLLCGNQRFWRYLFSILQIIIDNCDDLSVLTMEMAAVDVDEKYQSHNNQEKVGASIVAKAINFCKFDKRNISQFSILEKYYAFIKRIGQKVHEIDHFGFKLEVSSQFYLTFKFIQLLEKSEMGSVERFINSEESHSIYIQIYRFIRSELQANRKNEDEYMNFLAYGFFENWISHALKNQQSSQIEACASDFTDLCNRNPKFANKAGSFFDNVYKTQEESSINEAQQHIQMQAINRFIDKSIQPQNYFTLSLSNYFYRFIEELMQKSLKNKSAPLAQLFGKFEKYLSAIDGDVASVIGIFRLSFIKRYLSLYIDSLIERKQAQVLAAIDRKLGERLPFGNEIKHYLLNQLKNHYNNNQIIENFIKNKRCQWIDSVQGSISGSVKLEKQNHFFKNIKSVMGSNLVPYKQLIYKHFEGQMYQQQNRSYQIISFFINKKQSKGLRYDTLLRYVNFSLKFLSKIEKTCFLKISKYDLSNTKALFFLKSNAKNEDECNSLEADMKKFIDICHHLSKQKDAFFLKFDQNKVLSRIKFNEDISEYPLGSFICAKTSEESHHGELLTSLVEVLSKTYNHICLELDQAIKSIDPSTNILRDKAVDPFALNAQSNLLLFPTVVDFQNILAKYSHYSVMGNISSIEYEFSEIQNNLIKQVENVLLLHQSRQNYAFLQYAGDSVHFLVEMKLINNNQTLDEVGKKVDIQEYFKRDKMQKGEIFHKNIKDLQQALEVILIYFKNLRCSSELTIGQLIQGYEIRHLMDELKEEPFKSIPCSALVDLYEYIEFLTLENINKVLHSDYQSENLPIQKQAEINLLTQNMKYASLNNYPTTQQFKKALFRFVGRKILIQHTDPNEILCNHVCNDKFYWDQGLSQDSWEIIQSEPFKSSLNIRLSSLGWIIRQFISEQVQKQDEEEEISFDEDFYGSNRKMF